MKTGNITGFFLLLALLGGCIGDSELERTIFVRDKQHPELPQYSEWGYNTFGAYINDDVFVSGDSYWDTDMTSASDTTALLTLHGEKRTKHKDSTDMIMYILIPLSAPNDDQYLLSLDDITIDLKTSPSQILITSGSSTYPVTVTSGDIHFTRVQNLYVDNNRKETIISGTFEFQGVMDGNPVSVTLGRFDLGVGQYY
jgi:hypothetical protein